MTDVIENEAADAAAAQEPVKSEFKKYLETHPEGPEELGRILTSLYNNPMKLS